MSTEYSNWRTFFDLSSFSTFIATFLLFWWRSSASYIVPKNILVRYISNISENRSWLCIKLVIVIYIYARLSDTWNREKFLCLFSLAREHQKVKQIKQRSQQERCRKWRESPLWSRIYEKVSSFWEKYKTY